jgi:N6-L-threonylcarbamoyladenine synthase
MIILGIETSCDETSAGIIKGDKDNGKVDLLSNVVSSSLSLHAKTGGIIPEVAAREQVKYIIPTIEKAMEVLKNPRKEIDAIAVTIGPGLIGSLLVGVETARTIAYVWNKPITIVNHLFGHIYANWIKSADEKQIEFPALALIISGGHTDLVLIKKHKDIMWLGGTRDDAAGEAFDKCARLLNLPYPGGPQIEKMAENVRNDFYHFPRPMIDSKDFDFSFSGLKSAVLREVEKIGVNNLTHENIENISYSLQIAIFDVLIKKTIKAGLEFGVKSIVLGGGVASNQALARYFENYIKRNKLDIKLFIPSKSLCTDNGAMIAAAGFFNYKEVPWQKVTANPELYFD